MLCYKKGFIDLLLYLFIYLFIMQALSELIYNIFLQFVDSKSAQMRADKHRQEM